MTATASTPSTAQADHWITPARLAPFLEAAGADRHVAADLYVWHARLSSACMEVIHHVEVLVRNEIDRRLSHDEPENAVRSWLVEPAVLRSGELNAVALAITRLRRLGRPVTRARVVGGLPLSFWTRLLGTEYEELWKASLHRGFPHSSGLRKEVAGQLNRISQLRNEIAHHKSLLDLPVADRHDDMLAVAAAVDPAAAAWISALSRVEATLAERPGGVRLRA